MIEFQEDLTSNYASRTIENVLRSDITLLFCDDVKTGGTKCTINACTKNEKPYLVVREHMDWDVIFSYFPVNGVVNIAGNGMFTFSRTGKTQEEVDKWVLDIITKIDQVRPISKIVSGGQTGADESGLKAGLSLNIPASCLAPKGWRFRDEEGNDIYNEQLFKERFNVCKDK